MTQMQKIPNPSKNFNRIAAFTQTLNISDIPPEVTHTAKLLVLDLLGVLAAASKLEAGRIARNHAVNHWAAGPDASSARLLFDGRSTSLPGFGFAMGTQLDNLDAHDGWQPSKGHAGAALLPALCAFAEGSTSVSGHEALVAMVLGYEISYRASIALHATVDDYHTSGAWNALGCAAIGARFRKLNNVQFRDAMGIAEYHAPRSQMMREIANPSMLHDGTGWGAPTGIYAVLVAEDGFKGGPAATLEFDDAAFAWSDLGENWLTVQQYIKPYPVCRWVHAPIDAALKLKQLYSLSPDMIAAVKIMTFAYSAELSGEVPESTSIAQYSLAWPVAAALCRGRVGVEEVMESSFADPEIISLTQLTEARVDADYDAGYPDKRLANVIITLKDGSVIESGTTEASGGPEPQPTEEEVINKFRAYSGSVLPEKRVLEIESAVMSLDDPDADFKAVLDLLVESTSGSPFCCH
jgi:2-methylcitrate dehydratase PrpD